MENFLRDTEKGRLFEERVRKLYEERSNSLLFGCDFRSANLEKCSERAQYIHKVGNPIGLRYYTPLSEWLPPDEGLYAPLEQWEMPCRTQKEAEEFFRDIKAALQETDAETVSPDWDMDALRENPCLALLSWSEAYQRLLDSEELSADAHEAFFHSTIVLICLFADGLRWDDPDLAAVASVLIEAYDEEEKAAARLSETYPPAFHDESDVYAKGEGAPVHLEDALFEDYTMPNYPEDEGGESSDLAEALEELFEEHLNRAGCAISSPLAIEMAYSVTGGLKRSPRSRYLLPFLCAKLFATLVLTEEMGNVVRTAKNVLSGLEEKITAQLKKPDTLRDLYRVHRAVDLLAPEMIGLTDDHPLVLFMEDAVSVIYEKELVELHMPEYMIQEQMNTNWLALYLFGRGRYFSDPAVISLYSEITLPILLPLLFQDEEDETPFPLNEKWLLSGSNIEHVTLRRVKENRDLYEMTCDSLDGIEENMVPDAEEWRRELSRWVYRDELWGKTGLAGAAAPYTEAALELNRLNDAVKKFLRSKSVDQKKSTSIVRLNCIRWLAGEAMADLHDLLRQLASPERAWADD